VGFGGDPEISGASAPRSGRPTVRHTGGPLRKRCHRLQQGRPAIRHHISEGFNQHEQEGPRCFGRAPALSGGVDVFFNVPFSSRNSPARTEDHTAPEAGSSVRPATLEDRSTSRRRLGVTGDGCDPKTDRGTIPRRVLAEGRSRRSRPDPLGMKDVDCQPNTRAYMIGATRRRQAGATTEPAAPSQSAQRHQSDARRACVMVAFVTDWCKGVRARPPARPKSGKARDGRARQKTGFRRIAGAAGGGRHEQLARRSQTRGYSPRW